MSFCCIFVPEFPVQAFLRAEPELRSRPVAVLEGKAPLQKVFAVNESAQRMGIAPEMTKLQVEPCAGLALRERSPDLESAAHTMLLECALAFSPCVEDAGYDTILLDLAGMEALFGPLPQMASAIARRVAEVGLEANVAVAANPDAAALAARGFSGVTVIPGGHQAERLSSLPVEVLFVGSQWSGQADQTGQFLETLRRWGIRDLRALAALPEVALSERLGQEGLRLQQLARGTASRTLIPIEPPLVFEEKAELEHPLVLLEPLAFLLNQMLEGICSRLGEHALATQELRLRLELHAGYDEEMEADDDVPGGRGVRRHASSAGGRGHPPHTSFERTLRLPVPVLDAKLFLKLLQLDLKAHPPGAPIAKIHLSAQPVRPRAAQGGLFLPPSPEPEKLELTLARIAGIVGEERAGSLQLLDTHHPQGFRMQRFAPGEPQERHDFTSQDFVTALRILRPPVPVAVTVRDGSPARIACPHRKEMQGTVLWSAGPWRSSGDWWSRPWARDEWDIALQAECGIAVYRLVRDLLGGKWMVEGEYD
jgi:protein ImuB